MAHQNILFFGVSLIIVLLAMNIGVSASKTYIVGEEDGWDLLFNMATWPEGKTFYSGDILGCFTAEKTTQLRMMTSDGSSHHDAIYHSAIAARLASDFKHSSTDDR
ncbi:hypothetical protein LINPERHAP1_LOCUS14478 [Linum perenne]